MPPGPLSRHLLCVGVTRFSDGLSFLLDREPIRFVNRGDTKRITAQRGDTWYGLAAEYLKPIPNAEQLFWAICDFQPTPVIDPTVDPVPGAIIYVPSADFIIANYFTDSRRDQDQI